MHKNPMEITDADYTRFWQDNIQKLEEISGNLDILVNNLELEYSHFESIYSKIELDIDILSSIYAGVNALRGHEYILKLNAVIKEYRRHYTRDGIDFTLINFLISKINELRDESVSFFPGLEHQERKITSIPAESADYSRFLSRPYKWITFERNKSWFMTPFSDITVVPLEAATIYLKEDKDLFTLTLNDTDYSGRDIFSEFYKNAPLPSFFLIIDSGTQVYAATRIGKKIYAGVDFISARITPFRQIRRTPLAGGRVRIFGKNHIYLTNTQAE